MIFKRHRKQYAIGLELALGEARSDLRLETSRREGLQQDLLAVTEERDAARGRAARAEEEQAKALDRVGTLLETRDRLTAERDAARDEADSMGQGILAIHGERLTHTSEHDYDADHDDVFSHHQLAMAAAVYAAPFEIYEHTEPTPGDHRFELAWPWAEAAEPKIERPLLNLIDPAPAPQGSLAERVRRREARIHELAKAGSLIVAEIERIVRLGGPERRPPGRADRQSGRTDEAGLGPGPGRDR